jgi:ankyrin repeat protein
MKNPFPGFVSSGCFGCATSGHICNVSGIATQTLSEVEFEKGVWGAAQRGNAIRVKELLSRRPDWANLPDNYGFSPLHYAATEGYYEICSVLLDAGANPNIQTNSSWATALHRACYRGHLNVVQLLLEKGADPTIQDADGSTVLHKARSNKKEEIIRYLNEKYPNLKDIPNKKGELPV